MKVDVESLIENYFEGVSYDEMFQDNRSVKDTWKNLYETLKSLGTEELISRQKEIDWNLAENGITYNVYNDPNGLNRPWSLNLVPFIMHKNEWNKVEKGLQQRATLLDLVVKDIYGDRQLLKKGIIPHEVVFGHRGFLRQCDGIEINTHKYLSVYAADLSRGPDGRMWVVNDRAQAPSGMGYSLENRTIAGRVLPNIYRNIHVNGQDQFFNDFNKLLVNAAPANKTNPTVVVLTPGPHNETYFEHAYLASYYGFPLVRGSDLVVRDGKLWMKSLKALKQVDVVYRRVDDVFVDPLELREDSYLGVAGLLDVVRRKNVSILNPIGVGIIENSGLIPFMPAIAKYFLGEKLILPQIATWWCGQEKELDHVLSDISKLVIKRIDKSNRESIVFTEFLNEKELEALKDKIKSRPHLYVAQEKIKFSTVPNLVKGKLEPRNMVCRAFTIAKDKGYTVMSGGLVRVSSTKENVRVSNQRGGTSKDFCIIDESSIKGKVPRVGTTNTTVVAAGLNDLPSLTAENLYWAGRYIGRALVTSRHLRMVLNQMVNNEEVINLDQNTKLSILLRSVTQLTNTYPGFVGDEKEPAVSNLKDELISVIVDQDKVGSLAHTLSMFSNSYYSIRNLWSTDMWRVFDSIHQIWDPIINEDIKLLSYKKLIKVLDKLITRLIAFMGLIEESILVDQGLLLYFIGLNLERVILNVSNFQSMLTVVTEDYIEYEILEAMLHSHESLNIYRYSYRSYININSVISLILLDTKYARSLTYLVRRLKKDIAHLPHSKVKGALQDYEKPIFEAFSKLRLASVTDLVDVSEENRYLRYKLNKLLTELNVLLYATSKAISDTYFNHVDDQSQLSRQKFS
ncbi:circularly permuted type 2 ATP-grasp protein [Algibacter mikhailovii]|uniref:circularly permuted type 2 ATP-grasp protein n=1 Tax=Algibacter mikhailovii TaxID=425498 RepID=UPI0024942182|nr:circularly permuted type 2 ATP-grasp protein [Algibacter mikhailovii]